MFSIKRKDGLTPQDLAANDKVKNIFEENLQKTRPEVKTTLFDCLLSILISERG